MENNTYIMTATFKNFETILKPLFDRLIVITNDFNVYKNLPILNPIEEMYLKNRSISGFIMASSNYILTTDLIIEHDFELGNNGQIIGHLKVERNGEIFFINTDVILAWGEVNRPHYRYIVGTTNLPKIDGKVRVESVKKIDKLAKYVYELSSTKETENINYNNQLIARNVDKIKVVNEFDNKEYWINNVAKVLAKKYDDQYDFSVGEDILPIEEISRLTSIDFVTEFVILDTAHPIHERYIQIRTYKHDTILKYIDMCFDEKATLKTKTKHINYIQKEINKLNDNNLKMNKIIESKTAEYNQLLNTI